MTEQTPGDDRTGAEIDHAETSSRFNLERPIGEGGMAVVSAARDTQLDREVAIKQLRPELADVSEAISDIEVFKLRVTLEPDLG